jgi:hypothetical protein
MSLNYRKLGMTTVEISAKFTFLSIVSLKVLRFRSIRYRDRSNGQYDHSNSILHRISF